MTRPTIECPRCKGRIPVVATAYGKRAICRPCKTRWTYIEAFDLDWKAETL